MLHVGYPQEAHSHTWDKGRAQPNPLPVQPRGLGGLRPEQKRARPQSDGGGGVINMTAVKRDRRAWWCLPSAQPLLNAQPLSDLL